MTSSRGKPIAIISFVAFSNALPVTKPVLPNPESPAGAAVEEAGAASVGAGAVVVAVASVMVASPDSSDFTGSSTAAVVVGALGAAGAVAVLVGLLSDAVGAVGAGAALG